MITRRTRLLAVLAGALTFMGSAGVAHSAWSGTTEASLTISVPAAPVPPPVAPVASCGGPVDPGPRHSFTWSGTGTSYTVFRSTNPNGTYVEAAATTTPAYTHTSFEPGETVYLRVKAYNGAAESTYSNVVELRRKGNSANTECKLP
jgi:hypothetical protein